MAYNYETSLPGWYADLARICVGNAGRTAGLATFAGTLPNLKAVLVVCLY